MSADRCSEKSLLSPVSLLFLKLLNSDFGPMASGSIAGSGACLVSTPPEVIKTRLQLQGELVKSGSGQKVYTGFLQGIYTILKYEGLKGIYSGIRPAIYYQTVMNGIRFGCHEYLKSVQCSIKGLEGHPILYWGINVISSAISGITGAFVASPFYLVKTRFQSSARKEIAVGHQHHYTGTFNAFKDIIEKEGVRGLWRGAHGQVLRVGMGSAIQISTYERIKEIIAPFFPQQEGQCTNMWMATASAFCTSFPLVIAMNPVDVVATRLYNQKVVDGKGVLYSGPIDCLQKTYKQEGLVGCYKGTVAHYMRLAPHTLGTFIIFESLQNFGKRGNLKLIKQSMD